mmetsp:Transcript_150097/g.279780  ORF Transcript_150097/g.279780 Transcript_150097/m.279780 type:complete len:814 (+) Transcript_150097:89-2530(+)
MAFADKSKANFGQDVRPAQNRTQRSRQQKEKRSTYPFINSQIIGAASSGKLDSLLSTIGTYLPQMNLVNLSTAVHRVAKMSSNDQRSQAELRQHPVLNDLLVAISNNLQNQASCEATQTQCLSNVTWSLATLRLVNRPLIELLATLATMQVSSFKSYELSTALWGFAKLYTADSAGSAATSVFQAAAFVIPSQVHQFEFRCLSMIVWAFATMRQRNSRVFSTVATQMVPMVEQANSQEIANTAWAFGTVDLHDEQLFSKLAEKAVQCMHTFKPQELSNLIWGFASNRCYNEDLFARALEIAKTMDQREELQAQHLANILWGLARVQSRGALTRSAVLALLPSCTRQLPTFKPQEISSTAQAVAKAFGLNDEFERLSQAGSTPHLMELPWQVVSFFACTVPWAAKRVSEFSDQSLANIASACTTVHVCDDSALFKAIEKEVLIRVRRGMDPAQCLRLLKGVAGAPRDHCGAAVRQLFAQVSRHLDVLKHSEVVMLSKICVSLLGLRRGWDMNKEELRNSCLTLAGDQKKLCLEEQRQIRLAEQKEIRLAQHKEIRPGVQEEICPIERGECSRGEPKEVFANHPPQGKDMLPGPLPVSLSQAIFMEANAPNRKSTLEASKNTLMVMDRKPKPAEMHGESASPTPPGLLAECAGTGTQLAIDGILARESAASAALATDNKLGLLLHEPTSAEQPDRPVQGVAEPARELPGVETPLSGESSESEASVEVTLSSNADDMSHVKALTMGTKKDKEEAALKAISSWHFSVKNSFFHVECGSSTDDSSNGDLEDLEGYDPSWDSRSLQRSNSAPSISGTFW